ncbi:serine protease [Culex quinquefasciatus]|uniref:Serine protease n=1 Tax=Culex quinquefasciatus TaxID=7176 RepID=B0XD34_CULQU|nr:serine protease [Culex quinquefasciatus]|eukprot:XP_001867556.1 serine protease [Culex quinquefasciatus]
MFLPRLQDIFDPRSQIFSVNSDFSFKLVVPSFAFVEGSLLTPRIRAASVGFLLRNNKNQFRYRSSEEKKYWNALPRQKLCCFSPCRTSAKERDEESELKSTGTCCKKVTYAGCRILQKPRGKGEDVRGCRDRSPNGNAGEPFYGLRGGSCNRAGITRSAGRVNMVNGDPMMGGVPGVWFPLMLDPEVKPVSSRREDVLGRRESLHVQKQGKWHLGNVRQLSRSNSGIQRVKFSFAILIGRSSASKNVSWASLALGNNSLLNVLSTTRQATRFQKSTYDSVPQPVISTTDAIAVDASPRSELAGGFFFETKRNECGMRIYDGVSKVLGHAVVALVNNRISFRLYDTTIEIDCIEQDGEKICADPPLEEKTSIRRTPN